MSKTTKTKTKSTMTSNPNLKTQALATESTYALGVLAGRIGPADAALVATVLGGMSEVEMVALGATIDTARIVTDAPRIYGTAYDFFVGASPEQKLRLRGFSIKKLAVAVDQAFQLEQMQGRQKKKATDGMTRATLDVALQSAMVAGLALRDQAASALRGAAGQDGVLREEVDQSIGLADKPDALARGLSGLGGLLRRWLGLQNDVLVARLDVANLDAGYADELEEGAQRILDTATAARLRPTVTTQDELDLRDGINLTLMREIVRAFDHAHNIDPTIPRLTPLATRRVFNRRTTKKKTPPPPPAGQVPQARQA